MSSKSPCTNVCRLNAQQVCVGCGRNIEEIIDWSGAGAARKEAIVKAARRRLSIIARNSSGPAADESTRKR